MLTFSRADLGAITTLVAVSSGVLFFGVFGPYLLDDFGVLGRLDQLFNENDSLFSALLALLDQGGSGRPLSYFSFYLNADSWLVSALPFKVVNLILHIGIGVCAYFLCLTLFDVVSTENKRFLSFVVALIWLCHPINQSTVFYVVQRMTQFITLISVLSLIVFFRCYPKLSSFKQSFGLLSLFGLLTVIAILFKENGALIPLYLLMSFCLVCSLSKEVPSPSKLTTGVGLLVPCVLLFCYFAFSFSRLVEGYSFRHFSLEDRLATQIVVVWDYVSKILVPRFSESGLFFDNWPVNRSFLDASVLSSGAGHLSLVIGALWLRTRAPLVTYGVVMFYCSHLIESTFLPLELYFEHRNYLGSLFILIAVAGLIAFILSHFQRLQKGIFAGLGLVICMLSLLSFQNSKIWGSDVLISSVWASENPSSLRASQKLSATYFDIGEPARAMEVMEQAALLNPNDLTAPLQLIKTGCLLGYDLEGYRNDAFERVGRAEYALGVFVLLRDIVGSSKQCEVFSVAEVKQLLLSLLVNEKYQFRTVKAQVYNGLAYVALRQKDLNGFMSNLEEVYKLTPKDEIRVEQIGVLMSAGLFDDALSYIKILEDTASQRLIPLDPKTEALLTDIRAQISEQSD